MKSTGKVARDKKNSRSGRPIKKSVRVLVLAKNMSGMFEGIKLKFGYMKADPIQIQWGKT